MSSLVNLPLVEKGVNMTPACNLNSEGKLHREVISFSPSYGTRECKFINFGIIQQVVGIRLEGKGISGQRLCAKWATERWLHCCPTLFFFFFFRWLIESARWLIIIDKPQKGLKELQKAAHRNGRKNAGETLTMEVRRLGAGYRMQEKHICYSLYYLYVIYIIHIHKRKGK